MHFFVITDEIWVLIYPDSINMSPNMVWDMTKRLTYRGSLTDKYNCTYVSARKPSKTREKCQKLGIIRYK